MTDIRVELTGEPSGQDLACIADGLAGFNAADVGPSGKAPLALLVRDGTSGAVVGGLSGFTGWGWLAVEKLWLPETLRGRGLASRLLAEAEGEALRRGCHGAWLDTFNRQALTLYLRQGYAVFGELPEFPAGRSRYFLRKTLGVAD